jgi:2-aminobenzoate-CoA ligase
VTAENDTFVADRLPPRGLWPEMDYETDEQLRYPSELNVAKELLDNWLERPDRPAIFFRTETWSYGRLAALSNQICRVLVEDHELVPGSRVLLRSSNHPWLVAALFAIWRAGAIAVPTMPVLRAQELQYIVSKAKIGLAISQSELADDIEKVRASGGDLKAVLYFGGDGQGLELAAGRKSAETYLSPTRAEDTALIAFTSGTTGRPKGTLHFHRDLLAVTDTFVAEALEPKGSDIFCGTPQIAFLYGLCGLVLDPLRFGASVVLEERLKPDALVALIEKYRPTICFTTPSAFPGMLRAIKGKEVSSLRLLVAGGEPLPDANYDRWMALTRVPIINGLGVSELLHIFIASRVGKYRHGYVGLPVSGYEVKVADKAGNAIAANELGYLFVKGPTGCRYLDDIDRQKAYIVDGWNRTGDLCRMDADGFVAYVSRSDDIIVSAGYNISPLEVEGVLLQHPGVKECAVIGVPDPERTSNVAAYIVPNETSAAADLTDEIMKFARANLAPFKCPRQVVFVSELPRTTNDKIQRSALRTQATAR